MFKHNFKYAFKTLFRNKMLIFWTFAFPIILGTLFNLAFSNIENSEKLNIIDIAIVNSEEFQNDEIYKEAFKNLSDENSEDRLFNTKYISKEEAITLLEDGKITGYFELENNKPKVTISTNGINETIFKYIVEEIEEQKSIITNIANEKISQKLKNGNLSLDYQKIYSEILTKLDSSEVKLKNISNSNLSYTMIEFYTLIAMTCLYGGILGIVAINNNLPNMSNKGKRVSVAPISKGKLIFGSLLASYVVQLIGLALLFIYTVFVLKVDYGENLPLIILLALVGSLAGLSLGIAIGTLVKSNDNTKTGILIATTMLGCFLSGMMGITMKYIVDKNVPIVNKINPASMITDGLYSLYYYNTYNRYFFDVISLLIFSIIMIMISYRGLRRQKYDSI